MAAITIHVSEELNERLACAVDVNKLTAEDFIPPAVAEKLERPDALDAQTSASLESVHTAMQHAIATRVAASS